MKLVINSLITTMKDPVIQHDNQFFPDNHFQEAKTQDYKLSRNLIDLQKLQTSALEKITENDNSELLKETMKRRFACLAQITGV